MNWAASSSELVLQQLNRLQNANRIFIADARSGQVKNIYTDRDDAWVDIHVDDIEWIESGKRFVWVSEQDGWRHVYLVIETAAHEVGHQRRVRRDQRRRGGRNGRMALLLGVARERNSALSVSDAARRTGQGRTAHSGQSSEALTPTTPRRAPAGRFTLTRRSRPPRVELVRLPKHSVARVLVENAPLKEKLSKLKRLRSSSSGLT
jgi:dipeptidyl-peptidase-4